MSRYFDEPDTASIASTAVKIKDPVKKAWCQTQWTTLSAQARALDLPIDYFDSRTMLLDKLTNKTLWQLLVGLRIFANVHAQRLPWSRSTRSLICYSSLQNRLYNLLGPDKAPFAYPKMLEGGKVEWHNYADECKGVVGMLAKTLDVGPI